MGLTPEILDMFCKFVFASSLTVPSNFCVRDTQMRRDPNSDLVHRESKPLCPHTHFQTDVTRTMSSAKPMKPIIFFFFFFFSISQIIQRYCHTIQNRRTACLCLSLSLFLLSSTDYLYTHTQICLNIKKVKRK